MNPVRFTFEQFGHQLHSWVFSNPPEMVLACYAVLRRMCGDAVIDPRPKFLRRGRKTTEATPKPCTTRIVASHMLPAQINSFYPDEPIPIRERTEKG